MKRQGNIIAAGELPSDIIDAIFCALVLQNQFRSGAGREDGVPNHGFIVGLELLVNRRVPAGREQTNIFRPWIRRRHVGEHLLRIPVEEGGEVYFIISSPIPKEEEGGNGGQEGEPTSLQIEIQNRIFLYFGRVVLMRSSFNAIYPRNSPHQRPSTQLPP